MTNPNQPPDGSDRANRAVTLALFVALGTLMGLADGIPREGGSTESHVAVAGGEWHGINSFYVGLESGMKSVLRSFRERIESESTIL